MYIDRRQTPRRTVNLPVQMGAHEGAPLRDCLMLNISDTGAKLQFDSTEEIPDRFIVLLTSRGYPRRHCQVKWRNGNKVGVEFCSPVESELI